MLLITSLKQFIAIALAVIRKTSGRGKPCPYNNYIYFRTLPYFLTTFLNINNKNIYISFLTTFTA